VQGGLARDARQISIDRESRYPREPIAGENQGPRVAILSRNSGIDHDVL
jgi:hypothetical protein